MSYYSVCGISPLSNAASNNILTQPAISHDHRISLGFTVFKCTVINHLLNILTGELRVKIIFHCRPAFVVFIDVIRCLMSTIHPTHDFIRTRTCFVVIIFPCCLPAHHGLRLLTRSQRHLPVPPGTNTSGTLIEN